MFDFPTQPADQTEYTSGGITYVYNAATGVWDLKSGGSMSDYVLKAGDAMTGLLENTSAVHASGFKSLGDGTVGQLWMSAGDTDKTGNLEWRHPDGSRKAYLGWASVAGTELNWNFEGNCTGVRLTRGGIHMGNDSAVTDPLDMSRGLCLYGYGGTSQFGLSITSGTLNLSVQNTANKIQFNVGAEAVVDIRSDGVRIPGGNLSVSGTANVSGNIYIRDGDKFDLSNGYFIQKTFGSAQMFFHAGQNSGVFKFHITGYGDAYVIDKVGSVGNIYCATAPGAKATARELGVAEEADNRGVDIMKVVAACVAKINQLESEIATLKGT